MRFLCLILVMVSYNCAVNLEEATERDTIIAPPETCDYYLERFDLGALQVGKSIEGRDSYCCVNETEDSFLLKCFTANRAVKDVFIRKTIEGGEYIENEEDNGGVINDKYYFNGNVIGVREARDLYDHSYFGQSVLIVNKDSIVTYTFKAGIPKLNLAQIIEQNFKDVDLVIRRVQKIKILKDVVIIDTDEMHYDEIGHVHYRREISLEE
ncbi:hypothetical protein [Saprospira grandis]|uniref:hypothetical protein n=1 Tax=Saprospira grandis TaxID=1008 RepID=UPI0022DE171E|nr:hypothetical protein [Saprospira grandis]WBM75106.1 hypothetical protein OP864_02465 [Saprospira grandis]